MFKVNLVTRFLYAVLVAALLLASTGIVQAAPSTPAPVSTPQGAAPDHCVITGKITTYESIESANVWRDAANVYHLQVVIVYSGSGSYPPLFLNAWVDWPNDGQWSDMVVDTYVNPNTVWGRMTFETTFRQPIGTTVAPATWLRVMIMEDDWEEPCIDIHFYGDYMDVPVITTMMPVIGEITATGQGGAYRQIPTTGYPVELSAEISLPSGWTIQKCNWYGGLFVPGSGNPLDHCRMQYYAIPEPGPSLATYGSKNVWLTVTVKKGIVTTKIKMRGTYNVYFKRNGDDDADGIPNWFEYWKLNNAVPELNTSTTPIYFYDYPMGTRGEYSGGSIYIGPGALELADGGLSKNPIPNTATCLGRSFSTRKGINAVATVIAHEQHHQYTIETQWGLDPSLGGWQGKPDFDLHYEGIRYWDYLPDTFEITETFTQPDMVDSCDLEHNKEKPYKYYGDNEWASVVYADTGTWVTNPGYDWANIGSQSGYAAIPGGRLMAGLTGNQTSEEGDTGGFYLNNPRLSVGTGIFDGGLNGILTLLARISRVVPPAWAGISAIQDVGARSVKLSGTAEILSGPASTGIPPKNPTDLYNDWASLNGSYSTMGVDTDANGLYNSLKLSVGVDVIESGRYNITAWLEQNSSATPIAWATTSSDLDVGDDQTVDLHFDGMILREAGLDGPYKVSRLEMSIGDGMLMADTADTPHTTGTFAATDFDLPLVNINSFSDSGVDSGTDGLYDLLSAAVNVDVKTAGTYTISGELYTTHLITSTYKTQSLPQGTSQTINLDFDGASIYGNREDGPYTLIVRVVDDSGELVDLDNTGTTSAYTYDQFQYGGTTFDAASYSDEGVDISDPSNALDEFLKFNLDVDADVEGIYILSADLNDNQEDIFSGVQKEVQLHVGLNHLSLDFPGGDILNHGVDGPYQVTALTLISVDDGVVDVHQVAYNTSSYLASDFEAPLFTASGQVTDASDVGMSGVTVSDGTRSDVTDYLGDFSITGIPIGSYTLSAAVSGYNFSPATQPLEIVDSGITGFMFTGSPVRYKVSGQISPALAGVTVSDGTRTSPATGANGIYEISNVPAGTYMLTPSRAGYSFTPATQSVTVTNANVTGKNFTATHIKYTKTYRSTGTQDGHILESGENTNAGGTLDSTGITFFLGDGVADKQYRAILSFNTADLPDTATIARVTLKIKKSALVGSNPFIILGGLRVDIRKPYFGTTVNMVASDFQAAVSRAAVGTFGATPVINWYSAIISSLGYPHINKTGTTQFRLRFATDDNNDNGADYMKFFSGNYATATSRPTLIIEYYIP